MKAPYLVEANFFTDDLANMSVLNLPIDMKVPRIFSIQANEVTIRGNHAHKMCWQILISITHKIKVIANHGHSKQDFHLLPLRSALIVPPLNWIEIQFPKNSILTVLASDFFVESDYIRNFDLYIKSFENELNRHLDGNINVKH